MSHHSWKQTLHDFFNSFWAPLFFIGLIILVLIGNHLLLIKRESPEEIVPIDYSPLQGRIQQRLGEILTAHEVPYTSDEVPAEGALMMRIQLPADIPVSDLQTAIQRGVYQLDADIVSSASDPVSGRLTLGIGLPDTQLVRLLIVRDSKKRYAGKIAIIIDDFGDRSDAFAQSFLGLPGEITISVIPGRPMSETISRIAASKGCEVMLHLPMEPLNGTYPKDGYTLLGEMTQAQVHKIFREAIKQVPDMTGFNNHMGSRVSADRRIMTYLMESVSETKYYFIDSRTTAETVALETAAAFGIPCAKRDIFLDNQNDKNAIKNELINLAAIAGQSGSAIGIGHCTRPMLEVLREQIPILQEQRYRFVHVSELVR